MKKRWIIVGVVVIFGTGKSNINVQSKEIYGESYQSKYSQKTYEKLRKQLYKLLKQE